MALQRHEHKARPVTAHHLGHVEQLLLHVSVLGLALLVVTLRLIG